MSSMESAFVFADALLESRLVWSDFPEFIRKSEDREPWIDDYLWLMKYVLCDVLFYPPIIRVLEHRFTGKSDHSLRIISDLKRNTQRASLDIGEEGFFSKKLIFCDGYTHDGLDTLTRTTSGRYLGMIIGHPSGMSLSFLIWRRWRRKTKYGNGKRLISPRSYSFDELMKGRARFVKGFDPDIWDNLTLATMARPDRIVARIWERIDSIGAGLDEPLAECINFDHGDDGIFVDGKAFSM